MNKKKNFYLNTVAYITKTKYKPLMMKTIEKSNLNEIKCESLLHS